MASNYKYITTWCYYYKQIYKKYRVFKLIYGEHGLVTFRNNNIR